VRTCPRSLDPRLSRDLWTLLSGSFASAFGNGVVLPFLLSYLHNVRRIPLGPAGLVLAAVALAAIVAGPVGGLVASTAHPSTYELLFVIDAAPFLAYLGALALERHIPPPFRRTPRRPAVALAEAT
jgi:MFS family permease